MASFLMRAEDVADHTGRKTILQEDIFRPSDRILLIFMVLYMGTFIS